MARPAGGYRAASTPLLSSQYSNIGTHVTGQPANFVAPSKDHAVTAAEMREIAWRAAKAR